MNSDEVKRQTEELESLRSQTNRWRIGTALAIIIIAVVAVGTIIRGVFGLVQEGPNQKIFMGEVQDHLKKEVIPSLEVIAGQTVKEIKPRIEAEIKKLNDRSPELAEALRKQLDALTGNLPLRGEKVLNATFGGMLKKRESDIHKLYPGVTEEQVSTLVSNLASEGQAQIATISESLFAPHLKALNVIVANIDIIKQSEAVDPSEDGPTWDTALLIFDILRDDFKEFDTGDTTAGKAIRQKGHKAKAKDKSKATNAPKDAATTKEAK